MNKKLTVELDRELIEEEYRAEAEIPPKHEVTEEELHNYVFDVLMWHFQSEWNIRHREEEEAFDREEEERLRARVQEALDRGDYLATEVLSGLHYAFDETDDDEDDTTLEDVMDGYIVREAWEAMTEEEREARNRYLDEHPWIEE